MDPQTYDRWLEVSFYYFCQDILNVNNDIMDIICGINKEGTTVLLVTHDIKVALRSERILFLKDGSIAGEYHLGKYGNEYKKREEKLSEWLMKMDF